MNLNEASQWAFEISKKRNQYKEDGADVMRCLKHCAGEVIEAMDAYGKWCNEGYTTTKEDFADELADIVICILSVSGSEGIDIEQAISRKMLINESRIQKENYKEIKFPKVYCDIENGDFLYDDQEGNKYRSKDGRNWELEIGEENVCYKPME